VLVLGVSGQSFAQTADAEFDKTGDGFVDAADWKEMNDVEKTEYARRALEELGLEPDDGTGDGKTRLDAYLEGLRSVYGP
jgi:hypothetical protein